MACEKPADYTYGEHTADILVRAYGCTLEEAFKNAAIGTAEITYYSNRVEPLREAVLELEAEDLEGLLFAWISEVLYLFDGEKFAISRYAVVEISGGGPYKLKATLRGEKYNMEKHGFKGVIVKAMTYNMMEIGRNGYWHVQFVVDI